MERTSGPVQRRRGLRLIGAVPAAASTARSPDERMHQLKELGHLRASGVLTDAEFEREKARILG
jgi:hypothetical protein